MSKTKDLTEPLLQSDQEYQKLNDKLSSLAPEKKKILLGQCIIAAFSYGAANFTFGLIDGKDFPVTCLSWSGFFIVSILYKIIELWKTHELSKQKVYDSFFGHILDLENFVHLLLRALSFCTYIFLMILIANYAAIAQINFGILLSILTLEIVFQTFFAFLFFKEKLHCKTLIGIAIVVSGVVWITLSKSTAEVQTQEDIQGNPTNESEIFKNRLIAVLLTILTAFVNSVRPLQAKYLYRKKGYPPFQFSSDSAFIIGVILLIFFTYFYFKGTESYTAYNFWISLIAGCLLMIQSLFGLNSVSKGPTGPTLAFLQTHSLASTLLGVVILGIIPNLSQILAMFVVIIGAISILLL